MKSDNPLGPFGYSSIMMVHEYAYSKNKKSLVSISAKNPNDQKKLWQMIRTKPGLSRLDVKMLNKFYHCDKNDNFIANNWIEKGGCKEYDWCETALKVQPHSCDLRKWKRSCSITCKKCIPHIETLLEMETRVLQAKSTHRDSLSAKLRIAFYMVIQNRHPRSVDIIWKNYDGREVLYRRLRPNWTLIQLTYCTQPWIVRDSRWRFLLYYKKNNHNTRDIIFEGSKFGVKRNYQFIKVSVMK